MDWTNPGVLLPSEERLPPNAYRSMTKMVIMARAPYLVSDGG